MAFLRDRQEVDASQFQMNKIEIVRQKFEECKRLREGKRPAFGLGFDSGLGLGLEGIGESGGRKNNFGNSFLL